jgi:hypothetical protein
MNNQETTKLKIFSRYFPHNNIDIILEQVNRPNMWKKILRLKKLDTFRRGSRRRRSRRKIGESENHIEQFIRSNTVRKIHQDDGQGSPIIQQNLGQNHSPPLLQQLNLRNTAD